MWFNAKNIILAILLIKIINQEKQFIMEKQSISATDKDQWTTVKNERKPPKDKSTVYPDNSRNFSRQDGRYDQSTGGRGSSGGRGGRGNQTSGRGSGGRGYHTDRRDERVTREPFDRRPRDQYSTRPNDNYSTWDRVKFANERPHPEKSTNGTVRPIGNNVRKLGRVHIDRLTLSIREMIVILFSNKTEDGQIDIVKAVELLKDLFLKVIEGLNLKKDDHSNSTTLLDVNESMSLKEIVESVGNVDSFKEKCGAIIEALVQYGSHEILGLPEVREIYQYADAGDGFCILNWAFWLMCKTPNEKKANLRIPESLYKRDSDDIEKVVKILGECGVDPLKLNKKGESSIDSLKEAIRKGYFSNGVIIDDRSQEFANIFDNHVRFIVDLPMGDKTASFVIKQVFNKIASTNKHKFFDMFRWVFSKNPQIVINELVSNMFKYPKSMRNGDSFWPAVRETVRMYTELITYGSMGHNSDVQMNIIVSHLDPWNPVEELQKFHYLLGTSALNYRLELDEIDSDEDVGTFCSYCRGAIIGESGHEPSQSEFIKRSLEYNNGGRTTRVSWALSCLVHSVDIPSDCIVKFSEAVSTMSFGDVILAGMTIVTFERLHASIEIKPFTGQPIVRDIKCDFSRDELHNYFTSIVNGDKMNLWPLFSSIRTNVEYDQYGTIKPTEQKLDGQFTVIFPVTTIVVTILGESKTVELSKVAKSINQSKVKTLAEQTDFSNNVRMKYWESIKNTIKTTIATIVRDEDKKAKKCAIDTTNSENLNTFKLPIDSTIPEEWDDDYSEPSMTFDINEAFVDKIDRRSSDFALFHTRKDGDFTPTTDCDEVIEDVSNLIGQFEEFDFALHAIIWALANIPTKKDRLEQLRNVFYTLIEREKIPTESVMSACNEIRKQVNIDSLSDMYDLTVKSINNVIDELGR
jgi:hypothetical protein